MQDRYSVFLSLLESSGFHMVTYEEYSRLLEEEEEEEEELEEGENPCIVQDGSDDEDSKESDESDDENSEESDGEEKEEEEEQEIDPPTLTENMHDLVESLNFNKLEIIPGCVAWAIDEGYYSVALTLIERQVPFYEPFKSPEGENIFALPTAALSGRVELCEAMYRSPFTPSQEELMQVIFIALESRSVQLWEDIERFVLEKESVRDCPWDVLHAIDMNREGFASRMGDDFVGFTLNNLILPDLSPV